MESREPRKPIGDILAEIFGGTILGFFILGLWAVLGIVFYTFAFSWIGFFWDLGFDPFPIFNCVWLVFGVWYWSYKWRNLGGK